MSANQLNSHRAKCIHKFSWLLLVLYGLEDRAQVRKVAVQESQPKSLGCLAGNKPLAPVATTVGPTQGAL